ncbi:conjugative transfer system coupling protein TraD [Thioalkalivibrio sp. ALE16]|uniref:conjugative transfer system coupling protein TraD n=1 Tax=Thioalkalivibrio sp. ALE16 TaxID=1158172 RepID=UPI001E557EBD|nr:conjugative transfer system coupling protein TraD [Thioalkalivibrio sp. ALE16]
MLFTSHDEYEVPFRPNFELRSAIGWGVGATVSGIAGPLMAMPSGLVAVSVAACLGVGMFRGLQAWPRWQESQRIQGSALEFVTMEHLLKKLRSDEIWIGRGFVWDKTAANKAYTIWRRGVENVVGKTSGAKGGGAFWMHGLKKPEDLYVQKKYLEGHTLVIGTTGAGKTRLYDILLTQLIAQNDGPVVVIDPKGDHELRENMERACKATGSPERFKMFHPAYAERSIRIDPLKNWNRATEVASRITDLMSSDGSDPFRDIAWNALNSGIQGMVEVGEMPSLVKIRAYIEGGPGPLLARVLPVHFERWSKDWPNAFANYKAGGGGDGGKKNAQMSEEDERIMKMISFYTDEVAKTHRSSVVDGLVMAFTHNREHFQKLIASLIPILSMLTSDVLGELLSPKYEDAEDDRQILDMKKVIRESMVLYIGLDSLADKTVGSAIGAIVLSDLAAVAGDIYNYGTAKPLWICVDEASEVLNEPAIRILNKGRGAGMRAIMASQTMSDVDVRLGGQANALQALGNFNNGLFLRVRDGGTQEYITKALPNVRIEDMEIGYREQGGEIGEMETAKAGYSEAMKKEDLELVPPPLLGEIPDLQYFAHLKDGRLLKVLTPILKG